MASARKPRKGPKKRIVIRLKSRRLAVMEGRRKVADYPIRVGKSETPTPKGKFWVDHINRKPHFGKPGRPGYIPPGPDVPLKPVLIALKDATGRRLNQSIHGMVPRGFKETSQTAGCIRMRRTHIREFARKHAKPDMEVTIYG